MSTPSARLTVDDLLELAGTEKIIGFKWGDAICGVINPYLSVERRLTPTNTGAEALAVMKALPAPIQVLINEIRIDVMTGTIVVGELRALEQELAADREGEVPVHGHHPFDRPHSGRDHMSEYERFGSTRMGDCEVPAGPARFQRFRKGRSPNSMIMVMIAVSLVCLAFFLAFTTAKIANESGTQPNSGTLDVVIKTLGGVFRDSANTNPDSGGNNRREEPVEEEPIYDDPALGEDPAMEEDVSPAPRPSYGPR